MQDTRFLIAVGLNDYETYPLNYCVKDARDISSTMQAYCKVASENTFAIVSDFNQPNPDPYASLQHIYSRIASKFVSGRDSVFFYFSGHGVRSNNSTSVLFKSKVVELQELFRLSGDLKPKFMFFLIDSCYSGVGINDTIAKSSAEVNFVQQLNVATGYNIICASSGDAPAKESSDLKNGRLTRLFVDVIQNKINYTDGILNLSKVFQLIDEAFKKNPAFRQYPFSQTKGLSTYPISFLGENEEGNYFSTHYIEEVEEYDWDDFKGDLEKYCSIKRETINEFTRLVRELLRNCKKWSGATFLKIEIGKDVVSIFDNSGTYFDIFNPPQGVNLRGGGITAKVFHSHFNNQYTLEFDAREGETIQIFRFKKVPFTEDDCKLVVGDIYELWEFQRGRTIEIPEKCKEYSVFISQGYLDLSTVNIFITSAILSSQKFNKKITLSIDPVDSLKDEFIKQLEYFRDLGEHQVVIV